MSLYLYRVTVVSYPTPDGKPFDEQDEEFWQDCIEAYAGNPDYPMPEFMDWDFGEWIYQDSSHYAGYDYGGPNGATMHTDPPMVVPVHRRKHWMSRHAANQKAKTLREWGCVVTVEKSKPIEWEGDGDAT